MLDIDKEIGTSGYEDGVDAAWTSEINVWNLLLALASISSC